MSMASAALAMTKGMAAFSGSSSAWVAKYMIFSVLSAMVGFLSNSVEVKGFFVSIYVALKARSRTRIR